MEKGFSIPQQRRIGIFHEFAGLVKGIANPFSSLPKRVPSAMQLDQLFEFYSPLLSPPTRSHRQILPFALSLGYKHCRFAPCEL